MGLWSGTSLERLPQCGSILLGEMVWYPCDPHLCLSCKHKLSTHLPFCGSYLPRTVRRVSVGLNIMAIVTNSHSFGSQKVPHDVRVNGNKILFGVLRGGAPGWHPTLDQSKVLEEIGNFYWTHQTDEICIFSAKIHFVTIIVSLRC